MMPVEPRVAVFSHSPLLLSFNTSDIWSWHAKGFELHYFNCDISSDLLVNNRFSIIIYIGNAKRWLSSRNNHIPKLYVDSLEELTGDMIYDAYFNFSVRDLNPEISIFTPTYKSFNKFNRLYTSLLEQSIRDWEWIVIDDSPDDLNYNHMCEVVGKDHRVKLYKSNRRDALVGSTKRQAASLCNGKYLMEVDHDDELHHLALEACIRAFEKYPDAGFCYCDSAEVFEDGGIVDYGNSFAMNEGLHYDYFYRGRKLRPASVPINASTIRHIVGAPNHFRCWERNTYFQLQRHNNKFAVVDDYELLVRTFLHTRMIHIKNCLYIQYMNSGGNNTQEPRRQEIQRLVDRVQNHYDTDIHKRILELGGVDWMWADGKSHLYMNSPIDLKRSDLAYEFSV